MRKGMMIGNKKDGIEVVGDPSILDGRKVALFCSVKCPGRLILETYDLAKRFRREGALVISGFHSPMEQECFRILLQSPHPVIWCLARGMYRRMPTSPIDCRPAIESGRLAVVSPFPEKVRHVTAETAMIRNRFVASMADAIVVSHATSGGKMDALCREVLAAGKPLYTFDHPANEALLRAGAQPVAAMGP
jgi:predicted Rossmann fold nucleotide-binding protein DprA/Smf involved in DNA uptake